MSEAGGTLASLEVCDNVDLQTIVQEFEAYYVMRFSKAPKLTRKIQQEENLEMRSGRTPKSRRLGRVRPPLPQIESPGTSRRDSGTLPPPASMAAAGECLPLPVVETKLGRRSGSSSTRLPVGGPPSAGPPGSPDHSAAGLSLDIKPCRSDATEPNLRKRAPQVINYMKEIQAAIGGQPPLLRTEDGPEHFHEDRVLKPLAGMGSVIYNSTIWHAGKAKCWKPGCLSKNLALPLLPSLSRFTGEMRDLAEVIARDIYLENPDVK